MGAAMGMGGDGPGGVTTRAQRKALEEAVAAAQAARGRCKR